MTTQRPGPARVQVPALVTAADGTQSAGLIDVTEIGAVGELTQFGARLLTYAEAVELTAQIQNTVEHLTRLVVRAWVHEVWRSLGLAGWDEWVGKYLGENPLIGIARADRPTTVAMLSAVGMSNSVAAGILGVSDMTVARDLSKSTNVDLLGSVREILGVPDWSPPETIRLRDGREFPRHIAQPSRSGECGDCGLAHSDPAACVFSGVDLDGAFDPITPISGDPDEVFARPGSGSDSGGITTDVSDGEDEATCADSDGMDELPVRVFEDGVGPELIARRRLAQLRMQDAWLAEWQDRMAVMATGAADIAGLATNWPAGQLCAELGEVADSMADRLTAMTTVLADWTANIDQWWAAIGCIRRAANS